DRRGVDDVAGALPRHHGIGRHHSVHDPAQVDVDRAVPVSEPELEQVAADSDAGIVEDQVETAVHGDGLLDDLRDGDGVADVDARGGRAEVAGNASRTVFVQVCDDDGVAARGERPAQCLADARPASG